MGCEVVDETPSLVFSTKRRALKMIQDVGSKKWENKTKVWACYIAFTISYIYIYKNVVEGFLDICQEKKRYFGKLHFF